VSREFIEERVNASELKKAAMQERQLLYFTQNELQEETITEAYIEQWAAANYTTNDYFLNYIKSVFKQDNFLVFFKYLRKPIPSTKLINNKIKPQLNRVFVAENSDFKYDVSGVEKADIKDLLHNKKFEEELFDKILFNHNSILIEDLKDINTPYRYFIDIKDVVSLTHDGDNITRIAFTGCIQDENGKEIGGYVYLDAEYYAFYDKDYKLITEVPHDLGKCPADFIVKAKYKNNFIVRESIFTYIREELEEYNFLKTLQKMTDVNGAIPVVTKLDTTSGEGNPPESSEDITTPEPMSSGNNLKNGQSGDLQPGTIHEIPIEGVTNDDGTLNMAVVTNYLNFFYTPTEALKYIKERINDIENSIISTLIGTMDTSNEESKNEMQIEKSIIVLENTLISFAEVLNTIRTKSDYKMLSLAYGKERVNEVFIFYGTDFFLESQSRLFDDLSKAPNPIERKNILVRINQNKYKNNQDQMIRAKLLYDLLPYTTDADFEIARNVQGDPITTQYQLRFNYWVGIFEANYGDIVTFYTGLESDAATRLKIINDLIIGIIKENTNIDTNTKTNA
jgi:hypothetical protein